jgi:methylenetetrahydrofolate dehydrogenase (NADP+)/methenyltetrahydrofolate cyclohydrolase
MQTVKLAKNILQHKLNAELARLSVDPKIHAILLQMPLPKGLDARQAINHIAPQKDVDGLTAQNFGRLAAGDTMGLVPCTARGILHILKSNNVKIEGADVCIIGRSNIVGKPAALLLTAENATVTLCHTRTKNLKKYTLDADIIIVAAGQPKLLRADMIKSGAVVVDVGVNRVDGGICGDVDTDCISKASLVTPVPGGIGPLTIAFLLSNIIQSHRGDGNV